MQATTIRLWNEQLSYIIYIDNGTIHLYVAQKHKKNTTPQKRLVRKEVSNKKKTEMLNVGTTSEEMATTNQWTESNSTLLKFDQFQSKRFRQEPIKTTDPSAKQ